MKNPGNSVRGVGQLLTTPLHALAIGVAGAWILIGWCVPAAAEDDLDSLHRQSSSAMQAGDWEEGLRIIERILGDFGEFAYEDYGPIFGGIYYEKGFCEMSLKRYREAIESFRICHEEFPNRKPKGKESAPDSINPYEEVAVFRRALCEQLDGRFEAALKLYDSYLQSKPGDLQPGIFLIYTGICHANLGNLAEAEERFQKVFDNKDAYRVPTADLFRGFVQLGVAWARAAEEDPELVDALNEFLDRNLDKLRMRAFDMHRLNHLVTHLGQEAFNHKQYALALRYYTLFAGTQDAIDDLVERSAERGGISDKIRKEIERLEKQIAGEDPVELTALRGIAACYEKLGSTRASHAIFKTLSDRYPESASRAEILFHAARTAAAIGDWISMEEFGLELLEESPADPLADDIAGILVGSYFKEADYQRCVEIALALDERLPKEAKSRDVLMFFLGAARHLLQDYESAQAVLDAHITEFPESPNLVYSEYYRASNRMRLDELPVAARQFDEYIEKNPGSPLLDLALFDRAQCEYLLADGDLEIALGLIRKIEETFPDSSNLDRATILRGDIRRTMSDATSSKDDARAQLAAADDAYLDAHRVAETLGHGEAAAEALAKAIDTGAAREDWEAVVRRFDDFFPRHEETAFALDAVIHSLEALRRTGRALEGLERLETMIVSPREANGIEETERAVDAWIDLSVAGLGIEGALLRLENGFSDLKSDLQRSLLLVARIDLTTRQLRETTNGRTVSRRNDRIAAAFDELRKFDKDTLSDSSLLKIGSHIVDTGNRFEARPFFREIIDRGNSDLAGRATLELAKIDAKSSDEPLRENAMRGFRKVIELHGGKELLEEAILGLAQMKIDREDWNEAFDLYQRYRKDRRFRSARAKVNHMIGRCYEEQGDLARAQLSYVNVFVLYPKSLEWSAKSCLRNAEIEVARGEKRTAYEMLRDLERILGHLEDDDASGSIRRGLRRLATLRDELGITREMEAADEAARKTASR